MGAKTGLLVFAGGDVPTALRALTRSDGDEAAGLVRRIHPGYIVEHADEGLLGDVVYPPDEMTYAAATNGIDVVCDQRFMINYPSRLPGHLIELAAGRRIVLHAMHSVVDWLAFAIWEDGTLIRSLSLSPDGGIVENIGEPLDFEQPYWAGDHPVARVPGWPNQHAYPLPFHPLEMGEDALRALFGFILEGRLRPDDVDPYDVPLHGFRVVDPSGQERAAKDAMLAKVREMGPPRRLQFNADGSVAEVGEF
jgi:hypothetical protein